MVVKTQVSWKRDKEVESKMDQAYFSNDMDSIREYLGHSNPFIRQYASDKLAALRMAREVSSKPQVYSSDANEEGVNQNLTTLQYIRMMRE